MAALRSQPHQLRDRPPAVDHPRRRHHPRDGGRAASSSRATTTSCSPPAAPTPALYNAQFAARGRRGRALNCGPRFWPDPGHWALQDERIAPDWRCPTLERSGARTRQVCDREHSTDKPSGPCDGPQCRPSRRLLRSPAARGGLFVTAEPAAPVSTSAQATVSTHEGEGRPSCRLGPGRLGVGRRRGIRRGRTPSRPK